MLGHSALVNTCIQAELSPEDGNTRRMQHLAPEDINGIQDESNQGDFASAREL